jgi:asparagine synthase (glutamine-hydrolysing)
MSIRDQVRQLIDVNLSGFGGGQSAVDWDDPVLLCAQDDIAFANRLFNLLSQNTTWPSIDDAEEKRLFAPHLAAQMRDLAFESFHRELAAYAHLPYPHRAAYFALRNPDRRLFQYYTVFNRSHVEQRFPFYDYRYFEFVYALPPEMLYKRRLRRAIIVNTMPRLAQIPYDKDDLPITRSKRSLLMAKAARKFTATINHHVAKLFPEYAILNADYETWLRHELREWGEGLLLGERTLQRGFFNPDFLRSLWRRQQSGLEENFIGKIAPLMTWEMMLRRFYDQGPTEFEPISKGEFTSGV